ncbi:MAG: hypothetical protein MZV64_26620 [Ignavibacteriales bacterium]|nr:hypothetical protein [Ignavibacteriales bacterium]
MNLCNAYTEKYMNKQEIAKYACEIEIDKLKEPIGKQDQYACACGGLNFIEFNQDETTAVEKVFLPQEGLKKLQDNLLMFYTGSTRSASAILKEQTQNTNGDKINNLHKMVKLAYNLKEELLKNNIDAMGEILHAGWRYKKELASSISNSEIDYLYDLAIKNGATGGKLLALRGSGFLLFYVEKEKQDSVRKSPKYA